MMKITYQKTPELFTAIDFCFPLITPKALRAYKRYLLIDNVGINTYIVSTNGAALHRYKMLKHCGLTSGLYRVKKVNQNSYNIKRSVYQSTKDIFPNYKSAVINAIDYKPWYCSKQESYNHYVIHANITRLAFDDICFNSCFIKPFADDTKWRFYIPPNGAFDPMVVEQDNKRAYIMPIRI